MKTLPQFTLGMGDRRVRDNLFKNHIEPLFC